MLAASAIGPTPEYPVRHVWVRKGDAHFDPTWSRHIRDSVPPTQYHYFFVPIAEYRYFALPGIFPDRDGLDYLTQQAAELEIEFFSRIISRTTPKTPANHRDPARVSTVTS